MTLEVMIGSAKIQNEAVCCEVYTLMKNLYLKEIYRCYLYYFAQLRSKQGTYRAPVRSVCGAVDCSAIPLIRAIFCFGQQV